MVEQNVNVRNLDLVPSIIITNRDIELKTAFVLETEINTRISFVLKGYPYNLPAVYGG